MDKSKPKGINHPDWSAVRTIPPKETGNRGCFLSYKVPNNIVEYESQIERDFYLLLDQDPSVKRFYPQPVKIIWKDSEGKARKYVLDTKIEFKGVKTVFVEIKDLDTVLNEFRKYKEKFLAAYQYARDNLALFKVITENKVRTPRLANLWFTLGSSKSTPLKNHLKVLNKIIPKNGVDYNTLCKTLGENLGIELGKASQIVCYAIYHGLVWLPTFSSKVISADAIIFPKISNSIPFTPMWQEFGWFDVEEGVEATSEEPIDNWTIDIPLLESNLFDYPHLSGDMIEDDVEIAIDEIKFEDPSLYDVPPKYREVVSKREKIVKEWQSKASNQRTRDWRESFTTKNGVSVATIYRWVDAYTKEGIIGLIPKSRNSGKRSTISPKTLQIMEIARKSYLKPNKTLKKAYKEFTKACGDVNTFPSFTAFKHYVYANTSAGELARGKKGKTYYKTHFEPSMGSFQGAIMPMQVLQFDNTSFDVFPVDSTHGESIGTPYLVAAIDVYSGMITGAYLSLKAPSRLSVLEILVQSILPKKHYEDMYDTRYPWPIQGFPVLILVDNGMDYRAKDVREFCLKYDVILEYAPIRKPRYKAYIEKWFDVLHKALVHDEVPGLRPLLKQRLENPALNPEADAVLEMQKLEKWLYEWIIDDYHLQNKYDDLVPAPLLKINYAQKGQTSLFFPSPRVLPKYMRKRILYDMLNREIRKLQKNGIQRLYIHYNSDELAKLHAKIGKSAEKVTVLVDPRDIRQIWVVSPLPEENGRIIRAEPSSGWAAALWNFYGDKPISDDAWRRKRDELRTIHRFDVSPESLEIAEERRQEMLKEEQKRKNRGKKSSKRALRREELLKENEEKRVSKRLEISDRSPRINEEKQVIESKIQEEEIDWSRLKPTKKMNMAKLRGGKIR
ncbi:MAG: Mu transposase C-terminal domain-containing protein [Candidatus Hodarchaeales archaeon]|jgi:putative transposase